MLELVEGDWERDWQARSSPGAEPDRAGLDPIPKPRDAIELEVIFLERYRDDPLIGPRLWNEIDQIGVVDPAVRRRLEQDGFRIGQVGSVPPRSLQSLLGMAAEQQPDFVVSPLGEEGNRLIGRSVSTRSGSATDIQVTEVTDRLTIGLEGGTQLREYELARCVFRVQVERLQDDWVRLKLVPEIHHGPQKLRPVANDIAFQLQTTQKVDSQYGLQFECALSVGEFVIISGDGEPPHGDPPLLGQSFFHSASERSGRGVQRLLLIRVSDLKRIQPLFAE